MENIHTMNCTCRKLFSPVNKQYSYYIVLYCISSIKIKMNWGWNSTVVEFDWLSDDPSPTRFLLLPPTYAYLYFYDLSAWDGCWFLVSIWRFIYECLNVCPFDCTAISGSWKVWHLNLRLTTPVWWRLSLQLTVQSVRNRCVIECLCIILKILHQNFPCLKLIEIATLWVYYTIPFGFSLFWHFLGTFQILNLHVLLRITDEGSVPEMHI